MSAASPPPLEHSAPTRVRYLVLGLVAFAAASAYLTRYCVGAANTSIAAELKITNEDIGVILGAFNLGYLLFQVPGGWLGQRFGTRWAFAGVSFAWSMLTVVCAFAGTFAALLGARFAFGLAQAGLAPLAAQVLKDWIPENRRGMASSMVAAAMSVGGAATLSVTGWMLGSQGLGWRAVFLIWSSVGIVWSFAFFTFFRTRPEDHAWVNQAELDVIRGRTSEPSAAETPFVEEAAIAPPDEAPLEASPSPPSLTRTQIGWRMLTSVGLWALCVQSFFRTAGFEFYVNWLFSYLEFAWKVPKSQAGQLTNIPLIAYVVGALVGGVLVDKVRQWTGNAWLSRSGTAAGSLLLCMLLTWAAAGAGSVMQLSVILAAGAFFSGVASPAVWAATIDIGGSQTAVTLGIMNMAGCFAGVVVNPYVGSMLDRILKTNGNWNDVILLHVAIYAAAAAASLFVLPSRRIA